MIPRPLTVTHAGTGEVLTLPIYKAIFVELPGYQGESLWSAEIYRGMDRAKVTDPMDLDNCEDWVKSWVMTDTDTGMFRTDKPVIKREYKRMTTGLDLFDVLEESIAASIKEAS